MGNVALTREISPAIARCELTHLSRTPIDLQLARTQHRDYERALRDAGYDVERLPADADMPDSVFVEDIAIVLPEVAIVTRPGAASRRGEVPAVADALGRFRPLRHIAAPGTMDGGDVLIVDKRIFVGVSSRTNRDGVAQLEKIVAPFAYTVHVVDVRGCLHLKSAATAVGDSLVLVNPEWIPANAFRDFERLAVNPGEPAAANALRLTDRIVFAAAFPRTADRLRARGLRLAIVDASELAKAEGAVTCCSLLVEN